MLLLQAELGASAAKFRREGEKNKRERANEAAATRANTVVLSYKDEDTNSKAAALPAYKAGLAAGAAIRKRPIAPHVRRHV